jgi:hypothetical protein
MNKVELGEEGRIRALEARTTTWLRVAVVHQVLLVGLLASAYLTWGDSGRLDTLHVKVQTLEQGTRLDAHDTRLDALELGRIKHDAPEQAPQQKTKQANPLQLVEAIRSVDVERQLPAVTQIRKLLSIEQSPQIEEVIGAGVVPRLVQLMQGGDNPMLQFESAWALTNIASGTSEHTRVVIGSGAVPVFVQLLGSPNDDAREQVRGRALPCRL